MPAFIPQIALKPCQRCGERTPESLLASHTLSFHRGISRICLNCVADAHRRNDFYLAGAFVLPILLLPLAIFLPGFPKPLAMLVYLTSAIALFLVTVVPIHEMAHLFVARILGFKVPLLNFGAGDPLFTIKWPSLRIVVGSWIGSGACWLWCKDNEVPKWKSIAVSAAGPASNLLLLAISFYLMMRLGDEWPGLASFFGLIFIAGNGVYFMASAFPGKREQGGNDAAHILDELRGSEEHRRQSRVSSQWIQIEMRIWDGRHSAARALLNDFRIDNAEDWFLLSQDLRLRIFEGDWTGMQHIARLPAERQSQSDFFFYAAPFLVLADLHTRTPEDLADAAQMSARMMETYPNYPLAMTVHAMVLCATGDVEGACALLTRVLQFPDVASIHAFAHFMLAAINDHFRCPKQAQRHRARAPLYEYGKLITERAIPTLFEIT